MNFILKKYFKLLIFPPFLVKQLAVPLDVTSEQTDYFPHPCAHSCGAH